MGILPTNNFRQIQQIFKLKFSKHGKIFKYFAFEIFIFIINFSDFIDK